MLCRVSTLSRAGRWVATFNGDQSLVEKWKKSGLPGSEGPSGQPGLPRGWLNSMRQEADPEYWITADQMGFDNFD